MKCEKALGLLGPRLDGELSVNRERSLEEHLSSCAECRHSLAELADLRDALRMLPRISAPERLHQKIYAGFQAEAARARVHPIRHLLHPLVTHAGALAIGVALALGIMFLPKTTDGRPESFLAAHVASLKNEQLTQILASDTHKVRPWFEGRVDYAPIVVDLVDDGYPLVGGRVDLIGRQKTAALVYKWNAHVINLFVTPTDEGEKFPVTEGTEKGFNYIGWRARGFRFFAITGASGNSLRAFSQALQARLHIPKPPASSAKRMKYQ